MEKTSKYSMVCKYLGLKVYQILSWQQRAFGVDLREDRGTSSVDVVLYIVLGWLEETAFSSYVALFLKERANARVWSFFKNV